MTPEKHSANQDSETTGGSRVFPKMQIVYSTEVA
jgi:hypothetical protein